MKRHRSIFLFLAALLVLLTPVFGALPWGTRYEVCYNECNAESGEGTCVLSRKLPPFMVWIVRYQDDDNSGDFHPAYDTILQSTFIPTAEHMECSVVKQTF